MVALLDELTAWSSTEPVFSTIDNAIDRCRPGYPASPLTSRTIVPGEETTMQRHRSVPQQIRIQDQASPLATRPEHRILALQRSAGNRATAKAVNNRGRTANLRIDRNSEADRMAAMQRSASYQRDQDVSSVRNHLIGLYEQIVAVEPERYLKNLYPELLPRSEHAIWPESATEANYSAAASNTKDAPISNRARWALQASLVQYALVHGQALKC